MNSDMHPLTDKAPDRRPDNSAQAGWNRLFAAWLLAAIATLGSLFLGEVMGMKPCILCWYQRIFMYPLVIILLAGMFPVDPRVVRYALPLAIIGWLFAVYHHLLYSGLIPEGLQPCDKDASCAEINLQLFGFITIPMLSILAYTAIIALLVMFRNQTRKNNPSHTPQNRTPS